MSFDDWKWKTGWRGLVHTLVTEGLVGLIKFVLFLAGCGLVIWFWLSVLGAVFS